MIFIGRFIFNLILVVPYFFVCSARGLMTGIGLYLPATVLFCEEMPGIFLALYLFFHKDRNEIKSENKYKQGNESLGTNYNYPNLADDTYAMDIKSHMSNLGHMDFNMVNSPVRNRGSFDNTSIAETDHNTTEFKLLERDEEQKAA